MNTKFTYIKIEDAIAEPTEDDFYYLMTDRFWATDGEHIFRYRGASYQCNTNKNVVEKVVKGESHPGTHVIFLKKVWMKHDCRDF